MNSDIANVFKQRGLADELWSVVRNLNHYVGIYSGAKPEFVDGDSFKVVIMLDNHDITKSSDKILDIIRKDNKSTIRDIAEQIGLSTRAIEKQL